MVGDSRFRILIDPAPNQLILLTADSAFAPSHYVEVEATLTSTPRANPGGRPAFFVNFSTSSFSSLRI